LLEFSPKEEYISQDCGSGGKVYNWDGMNWNDMHIDTIVDLRAIWGLSSMDIYAVSNYGTTHYFNGSKWAEMNQVSKGWLTGIWGSKKGNFYMTGIKGAILELSGTSSPLGVRIDMPSVVHPGDAFWVSGFLDNPGEKLPDTVIIFALEVNNDLWFWDSWVHSSPPDFTSIDYAVFDVSHGTTSLEIIPRMQWPQTGVSSCENMHFYGVMLDPDTGNIIGQFASNEWRYGSEQSDFNIFCDAFL
jgi:hypothetical protein